MHEAADGGIEILHAGRRLPSHALFDKTPHVSQGAIVANNRLGAVLTKIQADQRERNRQRQGRGSKLTLRQKERIRAAQAEAAAPG